MPIEVQIPERDTPQARSVALVGAIAMLAGIGIAWWGMESERGTGNASTSTDTHPSTNPSANPETGTSPDANTDSDPDPSANPETGTSPDANANPNPSVDANPNASASADANPDANPNANPNASPNASPPPTAPPRAEVPLRVRRGRVAYLRCDGLRTCPRDERLEDAVWPILEGLATCAAAPTTPGEADIRLDYGAGAPEIAWRDTFPDDTVRLDRERVLGCLQGPLAATRQSVGATRLLVSFRFALVAR